MRTMVAALALTFAAGLAHAQYKTPTTPSPTPAAPPAVTGQAAPAVQITPSPAPQVDPNADAKRISRAEAIKMVKEHKAVWIDVRGKEQYEIGHIPGAMNIPLSELPNRWKDLPPHKYLITYCA